MYQRLLFSQADSADTADVVTPELVFVMLEGVMC